MPRGTAVNEHGRAEGTRSSSTPDSSLLGTASGKTERLENTLRPMTKLTRTMTLEEASKWLSNFGSYFDWNEAVLARRVRSTGGSSWRISLTQIWCLNWQRTSRLRKRQKSEGPKASLRNWRITSSMIIPKSIAATTLPNANKYEAKGLCSGGRQSCAKQRNAP